MPLVPEMNMGMGMPQPVLGALSPAVAPAPDLTAAWAPGTKRSLPEDAVKKWQSRIERAETKAKKFHPQWERGLTHYAEALVDQAKTDVDALLDYRHVESKKAQLFHRTPEINLIPVDPPNAEIPLNQILPLRQKFLNYELGPSAANAKRALHKTLVDTLAASGWMIVKVGHEQRTLPVPPDPMQPFGPTEVPIWSRRFISPVSSKKLLVPDDFHDTDYDAAPWLAVKGTMPVSQMRRMKWAIPAEFEGSSQKDEAIFDHKVTAETTGEQLGEYTEVWLKAHLFDDAVFNPELYRCLILVKGVDQPAWYVDSPYQALTPEGSLTDDSLVGNPIHVGTLRDLVDSAYVPSDLCVGEQLSTEENKFRTDLVKNRTARRPITLISDSIGQANAEKILKDRGGVVPGEYITDGGSQRLIAVVQAGSEPRDNFTAQDYIERDYEQALGLSANQGGQFSKTARSATEVRTVQGNSSARAETEKDRIREYFVALVRKFDTIVQRTATVQDVSKVLGQQGAQLWEQWKMLPGKYFYDVLPDAGQYTDMQQYRSQALELYNLVRKDPRVPPEEPLGIIARAFQRDPAKFIAPQTDKTTEPPKVTMSYSSVDLNDPVAGRVFLDLAANGGLKLSQDTIELMKAAHINNTVAGALGVVGANADANQHGGSADRTEPVNKHHSEKTGGMQGVVQ